MAYRDFKDLARRTASDKGLRDKSFNIAKNPKYDVYLKGFASIVYEFFDKKASGRGANNEIKRNEQLADELHKPIIKKLKKREFILHLKTIFRGADLADIELISKFIKRTRFFFCH